MRRAFTLIEIMIVVAIMAAMAAVSVVSVRAGQDAARVKGATRDIMASIRQARSMALVMMQPVVITYSTTRVDGEVCANVSVDGVKFMSAGSSDVVQTLSGEPIRRDGSEVAPKGGSLSRGDKDGADKDLLSEGEGDTMESILFAPMASEVAKGVRLKVSKEDEIEQEGARKSGSAVSVFSNVDYLLGKYRQSKESEKNKKKPEDDVSDEPSASAEEDQQPVSLIWEPNGRCEPHRVWIYRDGTKPEDGLCINVDRFGAAKVVSGEEVDK